MEIFHGTVIYLNDSRNDLIVEVLSPTLPISGISGTLKTVVQL
jgi:hypothetical protein